MTEGSKAYSTLVYISLVFCGGSICAALFGKLIISSVTYSPVLPSVSAMTASELLRRVVDVADETALQLLAIYIAGYSVVLVPVCLVVFAYRGVALGYTASVIASGRIYVTQSSLGLGERINIPTSVAYLAIYFVVTVLLALFSMMATSFFDCVAVNRDGRRTLLESLRYSYIFLIFAGASVLCNVLKLMLL